MSAKTCLPGKMDRKTLEQDQTEASPGPAAYLNGTTVGRKNRMANIPVGPAYTLRPRLPAKVDTESPGPKYNLERLTRRGRARGPEYSMAARLRDLDGAESPGPAAYKPRPPGQIKPKILLPLKELTDENRPAPNVYMLPSTLSRKPITLAKRIEEPSVSPGPGPAGYGAVPVHRFKENAPKYTLAKKFEDPVIADEMNSPAPGPQAYHPPLKYKYGNAPKFSFGMRRPDKFPPLVLCEDDARKK